MASNILKAGHGLIVWDIRPEATKDLELRGANEVADLKTLAKAADVTLLSLPDENIVQHVVCGPEGLIHGAAAGHMIVDLSTVALDPLCGSRNAPRSRRQGR